MSSCCISSKFFYVRCFNACCSMADNIHTYYWPITGFIPLSSLVHRRRCCVLYWFLIQIWIRSKHSLNWPFVCRSMGHQNEFSRNTFFVFNISNNTKQLIFKPINKRGIKCGEIQVSAMQEQYNAKYSHFIVSAVRTNILFSAAQFRIHIANAIEIILQLCMRMSILLLRPTFAIVGICWLAT